MTRYLCLLFCWLLFSHASSQISKPLVEKLTLASQEMQVVSSDGIVFTRPKHANKDVIVYITIKHLTVDALPEYMVSSFANYSFDYRTPLKPLKIYDISTQVVSVPFALSDYYLSYLDVNLQFAENEWVLMPRGIVAYYPRDWRIGLRYLPMSLGQELKDPYFHYYFDNNAKGYAWSFLERKLGLGQQRYFAVVQRQELMPLRYEALSLVPYQPLKSLDGIEIRWQPDETTITEEVASVEVSEIITAMLPLRALDAFASERWGDKKMQAEHLYKIVMRSKTGLQTEDFLRYLHIQAPDVAQFANPESDAQNYFVAMYNHSYAHGAGAACKEVAANSLRVVYGSSIPDCYDFDLWFLYSAEGRMEQAQLIYEAPQYNSREFYEQFSMDVEKVSYEYTYYLGVFSVVEREAFLAEGEDCTLDIEVVTEMAQHHISEQRSFSSEIIMTNTGTESLYWQITFAISDTFAISNSQWYDIRASEDAYVVQWWKDRESGRVMMKPAAYSELYRWDIALAPAETRRVLLSGTYEGEVFPLGDISCVSLGVPLPAGAFPPPPAPPAPVVRDTSMYGPVGASQPEAVDKP